MIIQEMIILCVLFQYQYILLAELKIKFNILCTIPIQIQILNYYKKITIYNLVSVSIRRYIVKDKTNTSN